jgi:hypothetical protein
MYNKENLTMTTMMMMMMMMIYVRWFAYFKCHSQSEYSYMHVCVCLWVVSVCSSLLFIFILWQTYRIIGMAQTLENSHLFQTNVWSALSYMLCCHWLNIIKQQLMSTWNFSLLKTLKLSNYYHFFLFFKFAKNSSFTLWDRETINCVYLWILTFYDILSLSLCRIQASYSKLI